MKKTLIAAAAALVALPFIIAGASLPETNAVYKALLYIETTQQADGGFGGGFGPGQTMDAILAIRSAGMDPNSFERDGNTPADYVMATAPTVTGPADAAKMAMGAFAVGLDPTNVGGVDLIAMAQQDYDNATGAFAADDFSQAIVILGLARASVDIPDLAITSLRSHQLTDGGWGFGVSDPDTTSIVLQAMLAAGIATDDPDVTEGIAYLRNTQNADAGWGYDGVSNTSSTAYAIQALLAAGEDPESATYTKGGETPVSYLVGLQAGDGSFPGFDPAFATNQVVPALAGKPFIEVPVVTVTVTALPTRTPTTTTTDVAATATRTATVVAPSAPNTGSGTTGDNASLPLAAWAGAALVVMAGGVLIAARKR